MNKVTAPATCTSCARLGGIVQCNKCRRNAPNKQTLTRRRVAALVADGMTVEQAETELGCTRTIVIG